MQYIFCKLYKYKIACSIFFENFTNTKLCAVSFFAKIKNIKLRAIFFCKLYKYRYKIVCNSFFAKFAKLYKKFRPAVNLDSWTLAQFTNAHPTEQKCFWCTKSCAEHRLLFHTGLAPLRTLNFRFNLVLHMVMKVTAISVPIMIQFSLLTKCLLL